MGLWSPADLDTFIKDWQFCVALSVLMRLSKDDPGAKSRSIGLQRLH